MIASTGVKGVFEFRVKKLQNGILQPTFSNFLSNFNIRSRANPVHQVWITRPQNGIVNSDD